MFAYFFGPINVDGLTFSCTLRAHPEGRYGFEAFISLHEVLKVFFTFFVCLEVERLIRGALIMFDKVICSSLWNNILMKRCRKGVRDRDIWLLMRHTENGKLSCKVGYELSG